EGDSAVIVAPRRFVLAPVRGEPALELRLGRLALGDSLRLSPPHAVGEVLANRGVVSIEMVAQGLPIERLIGFPCAELAIELRRAGRALFVTLSKAAFHLRPHPGRHDDDPRSS